MHIKSGFLLFILSSCLALCSDTSKEISINLIGIMVDFEVDENPLTSGDGKFLTGQFSNYIESIDGTYERCEGFIVDRPPHNSEYFLSQMEAVSNYFKSATNNNVTISFDLVESSNVNGYYTLPNPMSFYAKSDSGLVALFDQAINLAKDEIELYDDFSNQISRPVFVVFHAGISQDFSVPFIDPTIYDIKSAYIDSEMYIESNMEFNSIAIEGEEYQISSGILLPETQNHIFYDVVEDIWSLTDYCDIQLGLTGTFALQISYALGLPIMYNSIDSKPTIGVFGLTDYGYNNGRGVAPSIINPWTRSTSLLGNFWTETVRVTPLPSSNHQYAVPARDSMDIVYRIDINDREYFLVENRNNWINGDDSIDSLRLKNQIFDTEINDYKRGHWFDNFVYGAKDDFIEFSSDSVIVAIDNYDIGLPGSGILIWHIKEPNESLNTNGVNNIDRFIELEEADGSNDIGYESYAFFSSNDPTNGTSWDMWHKDNDAYGYANQNSSHIALNPLSIPNSNTKYNIGTGIEIKINSSVSRSMEIEVLSSYNYDVDTLLSNIEILGNSVINDTGNIFIKDSGILYSQTSSGRNQIDLYHDEDCFRIFYNEEDNSFVCSDSEESYLGVNGDLTDGFAFPMGYLTSDNTITESPTSESSIVSLLEISNNYNYSLGDINLDGIDEIIFIDDIGNLKVIDSDVLISNGNSVLLNNFPISGNYKGIPLVANIIGDHYPELILRSDDSIDIISNDGEVIHRLINYGDSNPLFLVPNWLPGTIALVNGRYLYLFDQDLDHSYWLNEKGRPTNYPLVTGIHTLNNIEGSINPYFYPNPVLSDFGKFRFFNSDYNRGTIKIYSSSGMEVDEIILNDDILKTNSYNEVSLDVSSYRKGIYFAYLKLDDYEKLIKMMVLK